MTINFLDLYNDVASQPWSMFDSGATVKEDFEPEFVYLKGADKLRLI